MNTRDFDMWLLGALLAAIVALAVFAVLYALG